MGGSPLCVNRSGALSPSRPLCTSEALESRFHLSATYVVADQGQAELNSIFNVLGAVRLSNNFLILNRIAKDTSAPAPFLIKQKTTTALKSLAGFSYAFAEDVSEGGIAVGHSGPEQATQWTAGKAPINLGAGIAQGISSDGKYIVGWRGISNAQHAHLFGANDKDLGTLGGSFSRANAVNTSGTIVGMSSNGSQSVPFYTTGSAATAITLHQIGGGELGEAFAINDAGIAVGLLDGKAFTFSTKSLHLDFLEAPEVSGGVGGAGFAALDINRAGEIVGYTNDITATPHATVWENGQPLLLDDLVPASAGLTLSYAKAINDKGQIIAIGQSTKIPQPHAYLLSPNLASVSGTGTLSITGTLADDVVSVAMKGSKVAVTVNGVGQAFSKSSVKRIAIDLQSGNDVLTLGTGIRAVNAKGGTGNDTFYVRNNVKDLIDGGTGKNKAQSDADDVLTSISGTIA